MPIYEVRSDGLRAVVPTGFAAEQMKERADIQRMLMGNIACLGDDLKVLAAEFNGWLDSSRRIDLLCIDSDANLVVVEIKRTDDGGHMELQALRYAAMVSAMTFDQAVDTLARHVRPSDPDRDAARAELLSFLGWDTPNEEEFGTDTRIILASADFSKEVTTTVLWLRDRGIDIRCVRLKPYRMDDGKVIVDIQQIIPLPEVEAFQTQIGAKQAVERRERAERHGLRSRFWSGLLMIAKQRGMAHANRSPSEDSWISAGIGRTGFSLNFVVRQHDCQAELKIDSNVAIGEAAFSALKADRAAIEQHFGGALDWEEPPAIRGWRICSKMDGGYRDPEADWPAIHERMIETMARLDAALRSRVLSLRP